MGSGRAKIWRILEWRIWSRWREINTQVFLWTGSMRTKGDPRKHVNTITSREVTSALELRAETTSLLIPLLDHKRRKEKKRKEKGISTLKTFSSFPLFLDIWLSTTSKIYYLQRGTSEHSNPSWRFCFIKNCLIIRCSLFVLC